MKIEARGQDWDSARQSLTPALPPPPPPLNIIVPCPPTLPRSFVWHGVLQCSAACCCSCCSALQCVVAVRCSVLLPCAAVFCCSVLQRSATRAIQQERDCVYAGKIFVARLVVACCWIVLLQCFIAVFCCSLLECGATRISERKRLHPYPQNLGVARQGVLKSYLHHTAAEHCSNTLQQCTATTHCNNNLQYSLSREQFVVAVCCCSVLLQSVAAECCCSVLLQCDTYNNSELPVTRHQDFAGMNAVAFVPKS